MVLEYGWFFEIKNAIRFNIDDRVVPILNHSTRNRENNVPSSNNFDANQVMGKFRNQRQSIIPPPVSPKKMDRGMKSNDGTYEQKSEHGLPHQVLTL